MQRIQNFTARVVMIVNKERDALSALKGLHWLPVEARIKYKILCLVFKCLHDNSALAYLRDLLIHNNRNGGVVSGLRLSDRSHLLIVPYVKYQTFTHTAFSVSGLRLWNNLPQKIQEAKNTVTFMEEFKTYLFQTHIIDKLC